MNVSVDGPGWALGCYGCRYGLIVAPPLTRATDLHLERLVQMMEGDLHFCACKAGERYRVSLLNIQQRYVEEARRDPRMQRTTSHPDIESAQKACAAYAPASVL